MHLRWTAFAMLGLFAAFLSGCSSNSTQPNATPILTNLSPSSITAGSQTFTMFISGQGLINGSSGVTTVYWNGSPRTGVVNTNTAQIAMSVLASDVASPGIAQITASNPGPGGGLSLNAPTFMINPVQPATPLIATIDPTSAKPAGTTFTLTVNGSNFQAPSDPSNPNPLPQQTGSIVQLNSSPLPTVFVNANQLTASVDSSLIPTAGCNRVTVYTPNGVGGYIYSPSVEFAVTATGVPLICSISPATAVQNGPAFTMNVVGANFTSSSTVQLKGNMEATTFIDASDLQAQIAASDLTKVGNFPVTVANSGSGSATSVAVDFNVTQATTSAASRFPQVVSASASGGAADGPSESPAISSDGRYVAFYSEAKNLLASGVPGNAFLRDTCAGVLVSCTPSTKAIDEAADGGVANGKTGRQLSISGDGRFVAFLSRSTNLISSAPQASAGYWSVYVRDLCTGANAPSGCVPHTEIVSGGLNGEGSNGPSASPSLNGDGRFVAFVSSATNISTDSVLAHPQVYVRDMCAGPTATRACTPRTVAAAIDDEDRALSSQSGRPVISADGRFVAYESWNTPGAGQASPSASAIVLADTCMGIDSPAGCAASAKRISYAVDGSLLAGANLAPSITSDARFVVFESQPSSANGSAPSVSRVFLRDTCLGNTAPDGCNPVTASVVAGSSVATDKNQAFSPFISGSGRYISFVEGRSTFASAGGAASEGALVVRDTCFGAVIACTARAYVFSSAASPVGTPASRTTAVTIVGGTGPSKIPSVSVDQYSAAPISSDGRFAAFYAPGTAAASPASGVGDVYISIAVF